MAGWFVVIVVWFPFCAVDRLSSVPCSVVFHVGVRIAVSNWYSVVKIVPFWFVVVAAYARVVPSPDSVIIGFS